MVTRDARFARYGVQLFLADLLERPVEAFSFHNPDVAGDARFDSNEIGGLVNAYGGHVGEKYRYVSD